MTKTIETEPAPVDPNIGYVEGYAMVFYGKPDMVLPCGVEHWMRLSDATDSTASKDLGKKTKKIDETDLRHYNIIANLPWEDSIGVKS